MGVGDASQHGITMEDETMERRALLTAAATVGHAALVGVLFSVVGLTAWGGDGAAAPRAHTGNAQTVVVGTGDLSELALGWSTYNGDHMSMYNPNSSIPKTLVKFLVGWAADNVIVIDVDQGHSGASAADREGFQRLFACF